MKSRLLLISAIAAAIAMVIMPVLVSDVAFAQSANRMNPLKNCYTNDNRKVPCDKLDAENKKADAMKNKKNK